MAKRIAKTAREVPTLGELRCDQDGVFSGKITGACGCVTWFEARGEHTEDEDGPFYRLVGLSDAKPRGKSVAESVAESGPEDAP